MPHIAILHPQCVRVGGAIQMALQTAQALQKQGHTVTLYTFEHSPDCFPELQKNLDMVVWNRPQKKRARLVASTTKSTPRHIYDKEQNGGILFKKSFIIHSSLFIIHLCHKCFKIATLAWHCRHVDIIIANNPPMQIVAALAKVASLKGRKNKEKIIKKDYKNGNIFRTLFSLLSSLFSLQSSVTTIWWHHHVPWYYPAKNKGGFFMYLKGLFERFFIIPFIDEMIVTSHFVADCVQKYCGREATVIHPVIQMKNEVNEGMNNDREKSINVGNQGNVLNDATTLFTHGRLEPGKGIDMLVRVFERLQGMKNEGNEGMNNAQEKSINGLNGLNALNALNGLNLIIFGTGSLETELRESGIEVRPFDRETTFMELSTGQYGHVLGVYCSEIDAFGMASLESQMAGLSTVILDRGGASEAILSDDRDEPVGYLVHTEEELSGTISRYVHKKVLEKHMSNVNFSHKRDYFLPERLSSDLLSVITKTSL